MKSRASVWLSSILELLLLFVVVALFYPRIWLPDHISPGGDMVNLMLPAREWAARWLARGIIPLWNPQTFGGVPFLGAMQAAVFYPPNLILGAFLSPLATINLLRFAHIYLFGALTWLFLRVERGHERPAALLGAVAVAGSLYVAAHTDHVNQLAAMAWLPALVACQFRWWRTGRPRALLVFAIVLALQILAGHPQAVFYSLLLTGALTVAFLISDFGFRTSEEPRISQFTGVEESAPSAVSHSAIRNPKSAIKESEIKESEIKESRNSKSKLPAVIGLIIALAMGFLLASIQTIPTAETSSLSRRAADDLEYSLFGSMPRRAIPTVVWPGAFGSESEAFVGRTALLLALVAVGVGIARRSPYAIFWLLIIVATFVLALGGYGPFAGPGRPSPLYRAYLWFLPPARHLRVPPRILLLATFALGVLAAEGLQWLCSLRRRLDDHFKRRIRRMAAWSVVAVAIVELWAFQRGAFHNRVIRYYPPAVMLAGESREGLAPLLPFESPDKPLADFRLFRLMRDDPDYLMDSTAEAVRNRYVRLQPNLGMLLGVAEVEGYEEGLLPPLRYFDFLNFFNRNLRNPDPDAVLLGLMNVRYLYVEHGLLVQSPTWRAAGQVVEPATGRRYRLYENSLWLPRVVWEDWLPREIMLGQLRGTYSRGGPPARRMDEKQTYGLRVDALAARGPLVDPKRLATLPIRSTQPNRTVVGNPTLRGGTLLVAQNAYPGWVVEAAGETAALQPATDFSGSAIVPPGAAEIAIAYRPFSFRIGAYWSGLGLGILAALLLLPRTLFPQPHTLYPIPHTLILASRSPRRISLLRELGLSFEVCPSDVEEELARTDRPDLLAMDVARRKAEDVARRFPDRLVLGADTIVCLGDRVLGKPAGRDEAREMLRSLRTRWHLVVTGLCLTGPDSPPWTAAETTRVRMSDFSDEELERYLATDEPMDKAGAYAIQGAAACFVEAIDGDYFNVVGLPLALLLRGLAPYVPVDGLVIPRPPARFAAPHCRQ
jgi:septum formation protein